MSPEIRQALVALMPSPPKPSGVKSRRKAGEDIPLPPRRIKSKSVQTSVATDAVNPAGEAQVSKQRTLTRKQQAKLRVKEHEEDVARAKKRLRNGSLSAAQAVTVQEDIATLATMISEDKSIRSDHPVKKVRSVKESKPKVKRKNVAVMYLNPRHHKAKVYLSPEQRAINKSKDGVVAKVKPHKLKAAIKSKGLSVVGAAPVLKVAKVRINPAKTATFTRKQKLSLRYHFQRKEKYSVYSLKEKVVVLKAA